MDSGEGEGDFNFGDFSLEFPREDIRRIPVRRLRRRQKGNSRKTSHITSSPPPLPVYIQVERVNSSVFPLSSPSPFPRLSRWQTAAQGLIGGRRINLGQIFLPARPPPTCYQHSIFSLASFPACKLPPSLLSRSEAYYGQSSKKTFSPPPTPFWLRPLPTPGFLAAPLFSYPNGEMPRKKNFVPAVGKQILWRGGFSGVEEETCTTASCLQTLSFPATPRFFAS